MFSIYGDKGWRAVSTDETFALYIKMHNGHIFKVIIDKNNKKEREDDEYFEDTCEIFLDCVDEYMEYATDEDDEYDEDE